ncbi:MAG: SDR family oxidoreductase [Clostridia bacterium]|nr:SDR family oxidoreductase [Clostridia bacterium]MBQ7289082.1 SDR family oxidoreductase [Clostridia bacterium]
MKTILITGASSGIGSATAILFAQKGYQVVINYFRSEESAKILCDSLNENGCRCIALQADVSDREQVNSMFMQAERQFGGIDILVNNAGVASQKLFSDITVSDWEHMMAVNLTGVFNCCQAALPYMIHQKSGNIVNVSSVWGQTGASCEVHYSAAKAGVIGLTKALAKEVGPSNIRVNCVAPGLVSTRMNSSLSIQALSQLTEETPLGRIADAGEIAKTIYFLTSGYSSFITGQIIGANGGFYI